MVPKTYLVNTLAVRRVSTEEGEEQGKDQEVVEIPGWGKGVRGLGCG